MFRFLVSALAFLLFSFFANNWYQRNFCCDTVETSKVEGIKSDATKIESSKIIHEKTSSLPFINYWGKDEIVINDTWPVEKSKILDRRGDSHMLEITGSYYADEINNTQFANLGIARAVKAKDLIMPNVASVNIKTSGKLLEGTVVDKKAALSLVDFKWLESEKITNLEYEPEKIENAETNSVETIGDEVTFRFPYKSTEKIEDRSINEYLQKLATRLKSTNEKVILVGHTDNVGSDRYNKKLGMERAEAIKSILVSYGIAKNRINASSEGEANPVSTNETEEGRDSNRRVTLKVK